MAREGVAKAYTVVISLSLVCSFLVAGTAIGLRPRQEANRIRNRKTDLLIAAGLYDPKVPVSELFKQVEPRIVDLATGKYVRKNQLDPATYNQRRAARNTKFSIAIARNQDIAGIGRREKYSFVYLVKKDGKLDEIILPVYGKGLWSTLYAYLALDSDLTTIRGVTFYQQEETPGLGAGISDPSWDATWKEKKIYNQQGKVAFRLVKGGVKPTSPEAGNEVDALSGATLTSNGVTNLIKFWLGKDGFKPFLSRLSTKGA